MFILDEDMLKSKQLGRLSYALDFIPSILVESITSDFHNSPSLAIVSVSQFMVDISVCS